MPTTGMYIYLLECTYRSEVCAVINTGEPLLADNAPDTGVRTAYWQRVGRRAFRAAGVRAAYRQTVGRAPSTPPVSEQVTSNASGAASPAPPVFPNGLQTPRPW